MILLFILMIGLMVFLIASMWKVFEKAGQPGWAVLIPFYNLYIMTQIVNKPGWWVLLMIIPYIGLIWQIWTTNLISKSFGKDEGFTFGLIILPFIFYPILGFGDASYQGLANNAQIGTLDDPNSFK